MAEAWIRSALLKEHGITGLFTTRLGGVSETPFDSLNFGSGLGDSDANIHANLEHLCQSVPLPVPHQARQVHGQLCRCCSGPGRSHDFEADGLLSLEPGTAVAVRTADCLPILLADPDNGIIAAVHAGWRGSVARIAAAAVEAMIAQGARREHILASLGPCIGPCCFVIDANTAASLASCSDGAAAHVQQKHGRYSADLAAINRQQLRNAGLAAEQIESLSECTACHPDRFYSYRRDKGLSGRHLAVVALPAST